MGTPTNMAALGRLRQLAVKSLKQNHGLFTKNLVRPVVPKRTAVYTETGAILEKPEVVKFGVARLLVVTTPFLVSGALISKSVATFLEENDIFVPDDDDD